MAIDKIKKDIKGKFLPKGEIVIYKTSDKQVKLEVKLEKETIWLNQDQIARLFQTDRSVITKHIGNIFKSGELVEKSNVQKIHIAFSDKPVKYYNLDAIISVGYRVNSHRATQFRIWATKTLKEHIIKGYTINQKRLLKEIDNFSNLQKAISFLHEKIQNKLLMAQSYQILNILGEYSKSISLLEQYDTHKLTLVKEKKPISILAYEECSEIIIKIKTELVAKKEASTLFGQEVEKRFESIINNLYQTFEGKELYKSIEEKSAHLLYFTIKDHPFVDGNKRIGSLLFVYFLEKNHYSHKPNGERKISDNALVALSLLIAVSHPNEKDVMIKIITNLLR